MPFFLLLNAKTLFIYHKTGGWNGLGNCDVFDLFYLLYWPVHFIGNGWQKRMDFAVVLLVGGQCDHAHLLFDHLALNGYCMPHPFFGNTGNRISI